MEDPISHPFALFQDFSSKDLKCLLRVLCNKVLYADDMQPTGVYHLPLCALSSEDKGLLALYAGEPGSLVQAVGICAFRSGGPQFLVVAELTTVPLVFGKQ